MLPHERIITSSIPQYAQQLSQESPTRAVEMSQIVFESCQVAQLVLHPQNRNFKNSWIWIMLSYCSFQNWVMIKPILSFKIEHFHFVIFDILNRRYVPLAFSASIYPISDSKWIIILERKFFSSYKTRIAKKNSLFEAQLEGRCEWVLYFCIKMAGNHLHFAYLWSCFAP